MNKTNIISVIVIALVVIITTVVLIPKNPYGNLDEFAKCIASKNMTMYGANWCSHCKAEKARFGDSFQFVPYIECPEKAEFCLANGINLYPTWTIASTTASTTDKYEGELGLEKIADISGCILPVK